MQNIAKTVTGETENTEATPPQTNEISTEVEFLDDLDVQNLTERVIDWFTDQFWTIDMLIQLIMLTSAFAIGYISYRFARGSVTDYIDNAEMPIRVKRTFNNLKRLILPIGALLILFIESVIASSEFFALDISFVLGVMKVLLAWIFIRIAVQFIANPAVRNFFALSIWVIAALSIFGILDETTNTLDGIAFSMGNFRLSALLVIKSLLSLFILLYMALFLSTFAERRVLKSKNLTRSSQVLIAKIVRVSLVIFALLIGVTSAGIDLSVFTVFSGAVGLGVGFGLQKVVSNLFSGMLLLMDKSIQPGDVIELENSGTFGWVHNMGARFTEIITRDNKSYIIPNEEFITQSVVNWSHGDKLIRISVDFGVHYEMDMHKVVAVAKEAATRPERVVDTPKPVCWMTEMGDSSVNFSLQFWIKDAEAGVTNVKGQVLLSLWDAFQENDIQIPYPHREVYLHEVKDKPTPKIEKKTTVKKAENKKNVEKGEAEQPPPTVKKKK